jgi:hypothetical protein
MTSIAVLSLRLCSDARGGGGASACVALALSANHLSISATRNRRLRGPNLIEGGAFPRHTICRSAFADGRSRYSAAAAYPKTTGGSMGWRWLMIRSHEADCRHATVVSVEDLADRALSEARQAGMPCRLGMLSDMTRQQSRCPKLMRIAYLLGLLAGQRHHPSAGGVRDRRLLARPRAVVERRHHAITPSRHHAITPSRQTAPRGQDIVARSDWSRRSPRRQHRSTGWRDTPAGSVPVEPDTPTPFATVRSPPVQSSQSLRSISRSPAEVPPSCPPVMLTFPSDYNMWEPPGNRVQLVGSMESVY